MVLAALNIAMLLVIWFKTNAVVEYASLLRLNKVVKPLAEFDQMRSAIPDLLFVDYLKEHHSSLISRLLSCPICVAAWLGMFHFILPIPPLLSLAFLGLALYLLLSKILTDAK
jgi:hypothetical protein